MTIANRLRSYRRERRFVSMMTHRNETERPVEVKKTFVFESVVWSDLFIEYRTRLKDPDS